MNKIPDRNVDEAIKEILADVANKEQEKEEEDALWIPSRQEWVEILSACKESNFFAAVRLLYEQDNHPQDADAFTRSLRKSPLVREKAAHINNAQPSINWCLSTNGSNITLRRALKKHQHGERREFHFRKKNKS
jgi:hypothetical protein